MVRLFQAIITMSLLLSSLGAIVLPDISHQLLGNLGTTLNIDNLAAQALGPNTASAGATEEVGLAAANSEEDSAVLGQAQPGASVAGVVPLTFGTGPTPSLGSLFLPSLQI